MCAWAVFGVAAAEESGVPSSEPVPCPANGAREPVTLVEALEAATRQNPRVIAAAMDVRKAEAAGTSATAAFLPSATASLQGEAFHTDNPGVTSSVGSTVVGGTADRYTNYPTVGANWNLYNGGKDVAAFRAAQAGVRASVADLSGQLNDTFSAVLVAYNDLHKTQLAWVQQSEALAIEGRMVTRALQRFRRGAGTLIALSQARLARARAERDALKACRAVLDKSASLAQAVGVRVPPGHVLQAIPSFPTPPPTKNEEARIEALLESDPAVAGAKERIAAAEHKLDEARASLYPTLALVARYDWLGQRVEDYTHAWQDTGRNSYRYGFVVQQTLFPYAGYQGAVAAAQADVTKAQAAYEEAYIAAQTRLRTAVNARAEAEAAAVSAARSAEDARQVLDLSTALYARGHADLDTVDRARLDANRESEAADEASADRLLDTWLAYRSLHPDEFVEAIREAAGASTRARE